MNTRLPINVVYIDDIPTPYRLEVFKQLSRRRDIRLQILFCALMEEGRDWKFNFDGVNAEFLKGRYFRPKGQINPFTYKLNIDVGRALSRMRPDVVVMAGYTQPTMWLAAAWCHKHGVPYGLTCESSFLETRRNSLRLLLKKILIGGLLFRRISFGLPTGTNASQYLSSLFGPTLRRFHFPNTSDTHQLSEKREVMSRTAARHQFEPFVNIPGSDLVVLFVGRLIDAKRPLDLLTAFSSLPTPLRRRCRMLFVGDGPLRSEIEDAADSANVHVTGWLDGVDVHTAMLLADVFVLPSIHEPWGAVVNEALAAGLPVIVSDRVGSAVDLVAPGINGYIFPSGDVKSLADQLQLVLEDDQLRTKLSTESTRLSGQFGIEFAERNFVSALSNVLP